MTTKKLDITAIVLYTSLLVLFVLWLAILSGCKKYDDYSFERSVIRKSQIIDTSFTGTLGYGRVEMILPKFTGDLTSVIVKRTVSVNYAFQLGNQGSESVTYTVTMGRLDSAFVAGYKLGADIRSDAGTWPLAPNEFHRRQLSPLLVHWVVADTLPPAAFTGIGFVGLVYAPQTYTILEGSRQYYFQAQVRDSVKIEIVYNYNSKA